MCVCFFSIWVFFHNQSQITGLQGKGEGISVTPHYHPFHRHLDISRTITADSSPLHIGSSRTKVPERKSLTTKLHALRNIFANVLNEWYLNLLLLDFHRKRHWIIWKVISETIFFMSWAAPSKNPQRLNWSILKMLPSRHLPAQT